MTLKQNKISREKYGVWGISLYKISVSTIRIILGLIIILFGFNLHRVINFLFRESVKRKQIISEFLLSHINSGEVYFTIILAYSLIILSSLDILFSILLLKRRKIGAVGLIITAFLWLIVEIFFISKFLFVHETITIILNIIIILFLIKLLKESHGYLKK